MATSGENEVELLQQNPLGNKLSDLPPNPYPSAPEPEPEPLEKLISDSQPNLPPPTYEDATDPSFMQRFQKFTPQWPGFHPAEVPRLARQMTRQMSRNNPVPGNKIGETSQEEKYSLCSTIYLTFGCIVMLLTFVCLLVAPVVMVGVGGAYYEECDQTTPYPFWLIVGGVSTMVACLFVCCLVCSENDIRCLNALGALLLLLPVIWFFIGCHYVWGLWDHHGNLIYGEGCGRYLCENDSPKWHEFRYTNCVYPYYFSYALVVAPFGLLGLLVVMFFLTIGFN